MKIYFKRIIASLLIISCTQAYSCPDQLLLIRHGEKTLGKPGLSSIGQERAAALVTLFTTPNQSFQRPTFVLAVADKSWRPAQTCQPTATALHVALNLNYALRQEANGQLAQYLLKKTGTGLACLEHNRIPDLVGDLTAHQVNLGKWHNDVFDRILVLHFKQVGNACQFVNYQDIPESVLPQDKSQGSCCTQG